MRIIEIAAFSNGAHRNQTGEFRAIPEGWAIIRENAKLENFPFGTFEVEERNGKPYMKEDTWVPGVMPEPEPVDPVTEPTVWDELDAAYQEGVNAV